MISYKDFAQNIKAKYPEYGQVDDRELAQKFVQQYPVYKTQVSLEDPSFQENPGTSVVRALGGNTQADLSAAGYEPGRRLRAAVGLPSEPNPFISPERAQSFSTPQGAAKNVGGDVRDSVVGAASWLTGLMALQTLFQPWKTREMALGDKSVSATDFTGKTQTNLDELLKGSTPEQQTATTSRLEDLKNALGIGNVRGESALKLKDIYDKLTQFEKLGRGYESTTPTAKGTELVSRATRGVMSENVGPVVNALNKYMELMYRYGPNIAKTGLKGAGVGAAGAGTLLLARLLGIPGFANQE